MSKTVLSATLKARYFKNGKRQSIYLLNGSDEAIAQYQADMREQGQDERFTIDNETQQAMAYITDKIFPINLPFGRNDKTGRWYFDNSEITNHLDFLNSMGNQAAVDSYLAKMSKLCPQTYSSKAEAVVEAPVEQEANPDDTPA